MNSDMNFKGCKHEQSCKSCGQGPDAHHMFGAECRDCDWTFYHSARSIVEGRAVSHAAACAS